MAHDRDGGRDAVSDVGGSDAVNDVGETMAAVSYL